MRTKLPDRRGSVNRNVYFESANGNQVKVVVTVGYDDQCRAREVFCADFKAGSNTQAIVMDACILVSRLLQHDGETPEALAASMCSPPSLIGAIIRAIYEDQGPSAALEAPGEVLEVPAT